MSNGSAIASRPDESASVGGPLRSLDGRARVAYFSMEIGLEDAIQTYSGGLGILAGDTLRSAADLGVQMVGVTLCHRKGYFRQTIDQHGSQHEAADSWAIEETLEEMEPRVFVRIEGRTVLLRCWRYIVRGSGGHEIPVYLLDTNLEENSDWDRTLTDTLYGGDSHYRLCQEVVLGIGGLKMIRALGHPNIETFHMNEGHSALLALHLLEERVADRSAKEFTPADIDAVRQQCVFTTHTPVPAGHDRFTRDLVHQVLGENRVDELEGAGGWSDGTLNMTHLALHCSNYVNGVAMIHGEVSREMFPDYRIRAVTNGVHAVTWTAAPIQRLFDRHIPEWRHDNIYIRYAIDIPLNEVRQAHNEAKEELFREIHQSMGVELDPAILTIGFARRATPYKRADLLFHSLERLKWIAQHIGPFQIIYGGKAHPADWPGKDLIRRVISAAGMLTKDIKVIYVPNYDMHWGRLLTSGVDIWLNTPEKTREASGTSGMKAALNGVPSLSVLDGWWIEGHLEDVTGWSIGNTRNAPDDAVTVAHSLYDKLERVVVPLYYHQPMRFARIMRSAIALNGSFFNTQRMVSQYVFNAYAPDSQAHQQ